MQELLILGGQLQWGDGPPDSARYLLCSHFARTGFQAFGPSQATGLELTWVSSQNNRFNYDFGVAFTPDELAKGASYNYGSFQPKATDMPGVSVFIKEGDSIFHTYSTFGRGIDLMNTAYNYLDLVPKGRDENGRPMSWLKYRDEYTR